jgi:hypothetical protein
LIGSDMGRKCNFTPRKKLEKNKARKQAAKNNAELTNKSTGII